ncbi:MAG: DUF1211 domain-containing protein [Verrucomicrobia bacterium]|nr:DUF1211 domain-containing protein [Verrucomicrobiota bacterium]
MDKDRTEAFSDGIFAVAITLLILDFKAPDRGAANSNGELVHALLGLWPSLLAFLISFVTILVMWINHHGFFTLLKEVDRRLLYANGFLLLIVTMLPFPTAVLAQHLQTPAAKTAAVFYCAMFVLVNVGYNLMYMAGARQYLVRDKACGRVMSRVRNAYRLGFVWYSLATVVSAFHAPAGVIICSLLWLLWARLDYSTR